MVIDPCALKPLREVRHVLLVVVCGTNIRSVGFNGQPILQVGGRLDHRPLSILTSDVECEPTRKGVPLWAHCAGRPLSQHSCIVSHRFASTLITLLVGIIVGCGAVSGADATSDYFTRSWLADEGLPTTEVNDVVQDLEGFLWVGTPDGLVRFDGVQFKPFISPLIARAAAKNIRALATTSDGGLLIVPAVGGLVELKGGKFSEHPAAAGLEGTQLLDVWVEQGGAIWLEMEGGRVRRWQEGRVEDFGPAEGLAERARSTVAESAEGEVWLASGGFVGRYEEGEFHILEGDPRYAAIVTSSAFGGVWSCKGRTLRRLVGGEKVELSEDLPWFAPGGTVRAMCEDRDGALWIGTAAHGLYRWADDQFVQVGEIRSRITSLLEDREGSIWVTSEGDGLTRIRPKVFELYDSASGLAQDDCDSVSADASGTVWVANRQRGVARISQGQIERVMFPEGSHRLRAYAVCADGRGGVWVSEDGLYRFDVEPPHVLTTVTNARLDIHAFHLGRNGDLWVGGENGFLGRYEGSRVNAFVQESGFPGNRIRCITEDAAGLVWVGTEAGRLFCRVKDGFTEFGPEDGLPEAPIRALYGDANGNVWVGTMGGGLVSVRNGTLTTITEQDGLPHDTISAIVEDDEGRLWFGSRNGLFHIPRTELEQFARGDSEQLRGTTFGRSEGLQGVSCVGSVQPMACRTRDGRLWFATKKGVLVVDVDRMRIVRRPPPVLIDEMWVNNRRLPISDAMRVPPLCKRMEFRLSVLSFVAPEKVRLRYRLEGVDSDWTEMTGRREVVYTGLQPGRYRMRVMASNSDGVWNLAGASLAFTVQPAWWQMWSVRAVALVFAAAALGVGVRRWSHRRLMRKLERLEQQHALEHERKRIAQDLHDDLGASVTQVGMLSEELEETPRDDDRWREQAGEVSSRVRRLARDLDAVVWSVNPGNDSLRSLSDYLSHFFLETLRHSAIRPRLQVTDGLPKTALNPEIRHHLFLIAKEAVNNIIKHSQATEATLEIAVDKTHFEMRIQDNGRGFDVGAAAGSVRNGLRNMRARAAEMGCVFEVSSRVDVGTMIQVRLKVLPHSKSAAHGE